MQLDTYVNGFKWELSTWSKLTLYLPQDEKMIMHIIFTACAGKFFLNSIELYPIFKKNSEANVNWAENPWCMW